MRAALAAIALVAAGLASPAMSQEDARGSAHAAENARLGYGKLRRGADGNNPQAPNAANYDETKVGDLFPPPLMTDPSQATVAGWPARREELRQLVEDEWVGRIPDTIAEVSITWTSEPADDGADHLIGQLYRPGHAMGPVIDAVVSLPEGARNVPIVIEYTYIWPPGFRFPGPPPPSFRDAALKRGWGHVAYRVTLLQADDTAKLDQGVIGMTANPRGEHDWGALRAWGWGASQLREKLAQDPRIDGTRIAIAGHSRFGKAVLVAAAFDDKIADALVSSSGAGGAKLMRRDYGERFENMADAYASVWYAPRVKYYAGVSTLDAWPVDAHMLIALRAPRPLLVSSGLTAQGDGWPDPQGQWQAVKLARPAWSALGQPVFAREDHPAPGSGETDTPLAFLQHTQGHVMWPAYEAFMDHAEKFAD